VRTVRLNRVKDIVVTEDYVLGQPASEIALSLLTPCKVEAENEGGLLLTTVDAGEPRVAVRVVYDGARLKPTLEAIPVEDAHLRSVWPAQLTRILLKAEKPALQDTWTVRIEPAKEN